jgi:SSS family solute:Na+ symporter
VTALLIITAFTLVALALGIQAGRGREMSLEQWSVGGRGFGATFVFLLMAGEIYTTFTFLGGSGWAYSKGGPAFYILCYGTLAFMLGYWLLPSIWRYAQEKKSLSQADFFASKYDSNGMGVLVSIIAVIAIVPYVILQLQGLGIIVSQASQGHLSSTTAVIIGAIVLATYTTLSGVHGSAWTAALKDILILGVVLVIGIYLPVHYYGNIGNMFHAVEHAKPGWLNLPNKGFSPTWFISTIVLSALGFYMWPHSFSAALTARNPAVFRKNAMVLPLYQLILLFIFFVGFTAYTVVPGLKNGDLSLLVISVHTFPSWFVGIIGGAGVLTALVPGSLLLTTAATMLAKNVIAPARPQWSQRTIALSARISVPALTLIAMFFAINGNSTIVNLLQMGYALVTQLFPALALSLLKRNPVGKYAAGAGMIAGTVVVGALTITHQTLTTLLPGLPQPVKDLHFGIVALIANLIVLAIVALVTKGSAPQRIEQPVSKEYAPSAEA